VQISNVLKPFSILFGFYDVGNRFEWNIAKRIISIPHLLSASGAQFQGLLIDILSPQFSSPLAKSSTITGFITI